MDNSNSKFRDFFKSNPLTRSFCLSVLLILILYGIYLLFALFIPKQQQDTKNLKKLSVCNNKIILGIDKELYCFIPVDGGDMMLGHYEVIPKKTQDSIQCYDTLYQYRSSHVNSFLIGETPVTNQLYDYVMFGDSVVSKYPNSYATHTYNDWLTFIDSLSVITGRVFRRPTNEEWEYAARGGEYSQKFEYAGSNTIDKVAWYKGNSDTSNTNIVCKQKLCNELGLFDMSGGVWEITSTNVRPNDDPIWLFSYSGETEPLPILRGGAYDSPAEKCALDDMGTNLHKNQTNLGLRLVLEY